jgi:hypothetical protein
VRGTSPRAIPAGSLGLRPPLRCARHRDAVDMADAFCSSKIQDYVHYDYELSRFVDPALLAVRHWSVPCRLRHKTSRS